jgi:hypothetical protein
MILVAAVVFAVGVLASVALLNTVHVPADVNTEQTARSLGSAERVGLGTTGAVERVFLVHTSVNETGERMPYADETKGPPFEAVIGNYSALSADLAVSDASRVVAVEYLNSTAGGSINGTFLRHNDSRQELTYDSFDDTADGEWDVIEDADSIPYFYVNVTGANETGEGIAAGEDFEVQVGSDTVSFEQTEVQVNTETKFSAATHDRLYPVELAVIDGVGEIRNATNRTAVDLDASGGDVTFHNGNETNGTYAISGTGDGTTVDSELIDEEDPEYQYTREDVVVNPTFRVRYTEASTTHNATVALYNRTHP